MLFGACTCIVLPKMKYCNSLNIYGNERNFFLPLDTEIDSVILASLIDRAQKYVFACVYISMCMRYTWQLELHVLVSAASISA